MVELKVWVEGIQRVVCGVCDRTTCQVLFNFIILIQFTINQSINETEFLISRTWSTHWRTLPAKLAALHSSNGGAITNDYSPLTNIRLRWFSRPFFSLFSSFSCQKKKSIHIFSCGCGCCFQLYDPWTSKEKASREIISRPLYPKIIIMMHRVESSRVE